MEALKGVRILDMTHVQAGPTCSQLLAWMGADVIKFENRRRATRRAASCATCRTPTALYFTMLNCNKRSITVNMKIAEGKAVFVDLLKKCDIIMENFGPGVLDRFGFTWEKIHEINPKIVMGSIKGFGSSGPVRRLQGVRERRAGDGRRDEHDRRARRPAVRHRRADRRLAAPACTSRSACWRRCARREHTGQGQYVEVAMMDGVMNLCRVKFRDHQRLTRGDLSRVFGADLQGHGRRAARRQRLGRRPARQRDPLQAARRQRLALRRGAGSGMGRRSPSASDPTSACPIWRPTRVSPRSAIDARIRT